MLKCMGVSRIALCCFIWATTATAWSDQLDGGVAAVAETAPASQSVVMVQLGPRGCPSGPERVFFESGRADIQPITQPILDEVARVLRVRTDIKRVRIEGHADPTEHHALEISRRRAANVRAYLIRLGVEAERLVAVGFGSGCRLVDSDGPDYRAKNRNVTVEILQQDGKTLDTPRCRDAKSEQGLAFKPR